MQLRPLGQSQGASALIYWIIPLGGDEKQDLIPREMPAEKIISLPASPLLFFFFLFFFQRHLCLPAGFTALLQPYTTRDFLNLPAPSRVLFSCLEEDSKPSLPTPPQSRAPEDRCFYLNLDDIMVLVVQSLSHV